MGVSQAHAVTYYLSPTGSDSSSGTSSSPWKTFGKFFTTAIPGDTLILKDGTFNVPTSGRFKINCAAGGNAANGTSVKPITVTSENPRKGFIKGDGNDAVVYFRNCDSWILDNLRIENSDTPPTQLPSGSIGYVVAVEGSNNIVVKRAIIRLPNRYAWSNGVVKVEPSGAGPSSNILFEDNEVYDFNGHGIACHNSKALGVGCILRRNYINPRGGGPAVLPIDGGSYQPMITYGGANAIIENNIIDIDTTIEGGVRNPPTGWSDYGPNNKMYGNIIITPVSAGFDTSHHPDNSCCAAVGSIAIDNIVLGGPIAGANGNGSTTGDLFRAFSCENCIWTNNTAIGKSASAFNVTNYRSTVNGGLFVLKPSITLRNNLAVGSSQGFSVDTAADFSTLTLDHLNAFNNSTNYGVGTGGRTNSISIDPKLGACTVFIPASSPMKNAGFGGKDIGANVLYAYRNGILQDGNGGTSIVRLWDSSGLGENYGRWLFAGAVIGGVNDGATNTVLTFHKKVGLGKGGCTLPAVYASGATVTSKPSSPQNLSLSRQ